MSRAREGLLRLACHRSLNTTGNAGGYSWTLSVLASQPSLGLWVKHRQSWSSQSFMKDFGSSFPYPGKTYVGPICEGTAISPPGSFPSAIRLLGFSFGAPKSLLIGYYQAPEQAPFGSPGAPRSRRRFPEAINSIWDWDWDKNSGKMCGHAHDNIAVRKRGLERRLFSKLAERSARIKGTSRVMRDPAPAFGFRWRRQIGRPAGHAYGGGGEQRGAVPLARRRACDPAAHDLISEVGGNLTWTVWNEVGVVTCPVPGHSGTMGHRAVGYEVISSSDGQGTISAKVHCERGTVVTTAFTRCVDKTQKYSYFQPPVASSHGLAI
ncbi:hypothetical protein B0H11DRAFT_1915563 [Mycena galericulata]|nr:hypothetical protein B0H11DRAFT_1915563 [Mycena galericulata]